MFNGDVVEFHRYDEGRIKLSIFNDTGEHFIKISEKEAEALLREFEMFLSGEE